MSTPKVFESEYRFMQILWEAEPINSTRLVGLCREQLGWSKATTYTVIRRLTERGVVKNEDTIVSSLVSREEVQGASIDELVERTFGGSVPQFLAAFTKRAQIKPEELKLLRRMIEQYESTDDADENTDGYGEER